MSDVLSRIMRLRRPRLLNRAARHGVLKYDRNRDLCRILRISSVPSSVAVLGRLSVEEETMEQKRKSGDASYSIARHVELLIALLSETGLMQSKHCNAP